MRNMKWSNVKKVPSLPGLESVEQEDGKITALTFLGPDGPVRFTCTDYSGIRAWEPTKPKTEKRFRVTGTVDDLDIVPKFYKERWDAQRQLDNHADGTLKIEEVDVQVDDTGEPLQSVPF